MIYFFTNFNDVVDSFEEEIINFTVKKFDYKFLNVMVSPKEPDLFLVGQKVMYDRYKPKIQELTKHEVKHLTVGAAEPKRVILVLRPHEGYVYRAIVNSKAKQLDARSRETITSRRIYKRRK